MGAWAFSVEWQSPLTSLIRQAMVHGGRLEGLSHALAGAPTVATLLVGQPETSIDLLPTALIRLLDNCLGSSWLIYIDDAPMDTALLTPRHSHPTPATWCNLLCPLSHLLICSRSWIDGSAGVLYGAVLSTFCSFPSGAPCLSETSQRGLISSLSSWRGLTLEQSINCSTAIHCRLGLNQLPAHRRRIELNSFFALMSTPKLGGSLTFFGIRINRMKKFS